MDTVVNYRMLSGALDYYERIGYKYIEVPWAVSREIIDLTARGRPAAEMKNNISKDYLIGSGEQGFLALEHNPDTALDPGKYVTLSPCFRPGDNHSEFHQPYFMKVELYRTDVIDQYSVDEMIWDATVFMQQELRFQDYHFARVDTPEENHMIPHYGTGTLLSADLNLNGIEVGSYGLRRCKEMDWVYGTGVAEPRFSQASQEYANFINNNPIVLAV